MLYFWPPFIFEEEVDHIHPIDPNTVEKMKVWVDNRIAIALNNLPYITSNAVDHRIGVAFSNADALITGLRTDIDNIQSNVNTLTTKVAEAESDINAINNIVSDMDTALTNDINNLNNNIVDLQASTLVLQADIHTAQDAIQENHITLTEVEPVILGLQGTVGTMQEEVDILRVDVDELMDHCASCSDNTNPPEEPELDPTSLVLRYGITLDGSSEWAAVVAEFTYEIYVDTLLGHNQVYLNILNLDTNDYVDLTNAAVTVSSGLQHSFMNYGTKLNIKDSFTPLFTGESVTINLPIGNGITKTLNISFV